jgi:hypothetical protein
VHRRASRDKSDRGKKGPEKKAGKSRSAQKPATKAKHGKRSPDTSSDKTPSKKAPGKAGSHAAARASGGSRHHGNDLARPSSRHRHEGRRAR